MQIPQFVKDAASKSQEVATVVKQKWDDKSPGEKARFVTTTAVLALINPVLPLLWTGVYAANSTQGKD